MQKQSLIRTHQSSRDKIFNEPKKHYLTFYVGETECVFPVSRVQEVLPYMRVTRLPQSIQAMKGLVNLRGTGIAVIDLHVKFALEPMIITKSTSMIVLESAQQHNNRPVLFIALADSVHEVIEMPDSCIEPKPKFGSVIPLEFVAGLAHYGKQFFSLLDVDRILLPRDLAKIAADLESKQNLAATF
ncbi:MAG: chemotaxis protein CheW [Spirochaetia bacterium]